MCKDINNGYQMSDGTIINLKDVKIENMDIRHIEEMADTPASKWDVFQMRKSNHDLREDLKKMKNEILDAIVDHGAGCPINNIDQIIEEKVEKIPEQAAEKREKKLKRIGVYLAVFVSLLSLLISLKQLF